MTLLTTSRRNSYAGSGITGPYAFGFSVFLDSDLVVTVYDAAGTATVLGETVDYTITGVGQSSGAITLTAALAIGNTLVLERVRDYEQTTDIRNQGPFFPETLEKAFDSVVMLTQQLRDKVLNAFSLPESTTPGSVTTTIRNFLAGYYLRVRLDGNGIEGVSTVIADPGFLQSGTGAVARTANAKMAERLTLADFGAVGDGVTDDTVALTRAIAAAAAQGHATIYVGPGRYKITSGITVPRGISIVGDSGGVAGGIDDATNSYPTFLHAFVGDFFTFDGSNGYGSTGGSGGGLEKLRLVQAYGTGGTVAGSAVVVTGTSADNAARWVKLRLLVIEECYTVHRPWTWAINADGKTYGLVDFYVSEVSTHTSGTGAIRLNNSGSPGLYNVTCYNSAAIISIGDTNNTSGVLLSNVVCSIELRLDKVGDIGVSGGLYNLITTTANAFGKITLLPGRLETPFVDNTTGYVGLLQFSPTQTDGVSAGAWRVQQSIAMVNAHYFAGIKAAGGGKSLIGLDSNDSVRINPLGDAAVYVGAPVAAALAGIAVGDFAVQGRIRSAYEFDGTGTPEGNVAGPIGAVYHRRDGGAGTCLYVKESGTGNTGWVGK